MSDKSLIEEQTAYYRARAAEYDEWFLRQGRYDRGDDHRQKWNNECEVVRNALTALGAFSKTLEIACGTGQWT
ncbi:hypothetical protein N9B73_03160 [Verrucomicrobiales bacterium]|nr:hypothetical protein [Verrucomicrobiales bacterium]